MSSVVAVVLAAYGGYRLAGGLLLTRTASKCRRHGVRNVLRLAETPVELDVHDRPRVNVVQKESWVELRVRSLGHPRHGTRARNALYRDILGRFDDAPRPGGVPRRS